MRASNGQPQFSQLNGKPTPHNPKNNIGYILIFFFPQKVDIKSDFPKARRHLMCVKGLKKMLT